MWRKRSFAQSVRRRRNRVPLGPLPWARRVGKLALACIWEATARKAGNVHRGADFPDVTYADFLASAAAAAPELALAQFRPLGETVLTAIRATRSVVRTNTNLGIVLLLAPLAKVGEGVDLRRGISSVLEHTTIADAIYVYEAIRLAMPGGLGEAKEQDVRLVPTASLREVMALAAERDLVARQYINVFADVFELGVPALLEGIRQFQRLEPAIQHCQLVWLAKHPDSLIARKRGLEVATEASRRAGSILEMGGLGTRPGEAPATISTAGYVKTAMPAIRARRPTWSPPACSPPCANVAYPWTPRCSFSFQVSSSKSVTETGRDLKI